MLPPVFKIVSQGTEYTVVLCIHTKQKMFSSLPYLCLKGLGFSMNVFCVVAHFECVLFEIEYACKIQLLYVCP